MYDERAHLYGKAVQNEAMRVAEHERLVQEATAGQASIIEVVATKPIDFFGPRPVTTTPVRDTN